MADKVKFKINSDKFVDFISKLDDLTKIEDTIKLKIDNDNIFEVIMEVCKKCSLGQITNALFEVGGQYRRNM